MSNVIVLVDFSGLSWCCWAPAVSAQEAGQKALAEHQAKCASCELGEPCPTKPRQYDPKKVLLENIDLKLQTLYDAIDVPVKSWIMVKDGRDERRRQLYPAYKGNREEKSFDPRPMTEEYLRTKGCRFCWCPDAEADDTIATMAIDLSEAGMRVVIVSADKDLWQVWNPPYVRIYLTTKKEWLTVDYMDKRMRVTDPRHIRLVKALWGDPSDNLPNALPRMQKQVLPLLKKSDGSLDAFLSSMSTVAVGDRCMELLDKGRDQIRTNYEVVGLYTDVPVTWL